MVDAQRDKSEAPSRCPVRDVDMWSQDFNDHYWETMADLRENSPIARHTQGTTPVWLATRYDDVWNISQDWETFSNDGPVAVISGDDPSYPPEPRFVPLETDPPLHTQWRKVVNPLFTVKKMKRHIPVIQQITDELVDAIRPYGQSNIMADVVRPLQSRTIFSVVLGLPPENLQQWEQWAHDSLVNPERAEEAAAAMSNALGEILEERQSSPGPAGDIVTTIAQASPDGREPDLSERLKVLLAIITGGLESTGTVLSGAIHHLATHPADRDELAGDLSLVDEAVEEALRLFVNVTVLQRHVTQPANVQGQALQPGDKIWNCYGSANRDEDHFPEGDTWSLSRENKKHVSFGAGIHRCVGAPLARIFLETALERIVTKLPNLRLDPDQDIEWHTMPTRGAHEFRVLYNTPSSPSEEPLERA